MTTVALRASSSELYQPESSVLFFSFSPHSCHLLFCGNDELIADTRMSHARLVVAQVSPPSPPRNNIEHPRTCGTIYRQRWVTECYGSPRWNDYLQHTLYEVNWAGRRHYIILGGLMSLPVSVNIWRVIKKTEPGWRLTLCFHKRLIYILFSNNFFFMAGQPVTKQELFHLLGDPFTCKNAPRGCRFKLGHLRI